MHESASPVSEPYRELWLGSNERGVMSVVGLYEVRDLEALQALADSEPLVHFVDPAGGISRLFRQYRRQTIWFTLISYVAVLLLLLMRYGLAGGLVVTAVPAIAAMVARINTITLSVLCPSFLRPLAPRGDQQPSSSGSAGVKQRYDPALINRRRSPSTYCLPCRSRSQRPPRSRRHRPLPESARGTWAASAGTGEDHRIS